MPKIPTKKSNNNIDTPKFKVGDLVKITHFNDQGEYAIIEEILDRIIRTNPINDDIETCGNYNFKVSKTAISGKQLFNINYCVKFLRLVKCPNYLKT